MTKRELAELLLTARKTASRIGCAYTPNRDRLIMMGFSHEDIDNVEWAVKEIERATEAQLAALQR
ncbi:hypothetical protein IVB12_16180 [Bradyrhizobium sp. 179]|uniref:hypothetical protein n=1 Tax=Bradyrhizobium sp. 179 TaxID=2782648 RepID=UPI001FFAE532|nr:hypothetical protein [Bradyrhizobium sp. 179]MCK1543456.1 hypothetical protein [Bradyrhizobium sp. 179]